MANYEKGTYKFLVKHQGFTESKEKGTPGFFLEGEPVALLVGDEWENVEKRYGRTITQQEWEAAQRRQIDQARAMMGLAGFLCLMALEFALAVLGFGVDPGAFLRGLATPVGAVGLAGQIAFALIPLVVARRSRNRHARRRQPLRWGWRGLRRAEG